jgi:aspartyl-tRNA(Asn)/glutamyl-tRNA(Gln) amidotransferase subunit C
MIDKEQVHKVALLARLELTSEEEEKFTTQLGSILGYIEQLNELDVNDVSPTTRAIDVSNVTRTDDLQSYPEREAILNGAPDREEEFFKVPKILNEES